MKEQLESIRLKAMTALEDAETPAALEELLDFVQPLGALGVNVAHSGTVIGVIWPAGIPESYLEKTVRKICLRFPDLALLRQARLISGGVDIRFDTSPPLFETS